MVKDDWPSQGMTDQDLTKNFEVKIQSAHGERWLTSLQDITDHSLGYNSEVKS